MKKLFVIVSLLAALMLSVWGAAAQEDEQDEYNPSNIAWTCPEGFEGQTLNVYNWATYIGSNTISTFEELCGVSVTYDVYDTNESMVARLRQGNPGYDIAFPTDYIIPVMIEEELIIPLDRDRIPNLQNVDAVWRGMAFDPDDEYTVPYMWGTTGIAYNTETVAGAPTTWMDLFTYEGKVAWINDSRVMLSVALKVLGYDPNSTSAVEIEEARDFLVAHADNVIAVASDDGQALLERGEVDMVIEYGGDIYQLALDCECDTYAYVLPEDGTILDLSAMVLLKEGPSPELAMAFMDYILDPYVNGQITNEIVYPTANWVAMEEGFVDETLLEDPLVYPDLENAGESWFMESIGDADVLYNDAWDETLILIGR